MQLNVTINENIAEILKKNINAKNRQFINQSEFIRAAIVHYDQILYENECKNKSWNTLEYLILESEKSGIINDSIKEITDNFLSSIG